MAYRITICDDSQTDAGYVETLLLTWAQSRQAEVHIRRFSSAEQYLFSYAEDKCDDILLLDIEMGAMDGVTLARKLRQENETIQIVFVTGYSDYIAEGYDVAALHYLMKPLNAEKFQSVLDRAVEKLQKNERVMNLEIGGEMVRVPLYQIRYLDVRQNYVTIHGKQDFTIKRPLGVSTGGLREKELHFPAGKNLRQFLFPLFHMDIPHRILTEQPKGDQVSIEIAHTGHRPGYGCHRAIHLP